MHILEREDKEIRHLEIEHMVVAGAITAVMVLSFIIGTLFY
jgi:hypothetical protein